MIQAHLLSQAFLKTPEGSGRSDSLDLTEPSSGVRSCEAGLEQKPFLQPQSTSVNGISHFPLPVAKSRSRQAGTAPPFPFSR